MGLVRKMIGFFRKIFGRRRKYIGIREAQEMKMRKDHFEKRKY